MMQHEIQLYEKSNRISRHWLELSNLNHYKLIELNQWWCEDKFSRIALHKMIVE